MIGLVVVYCRYWRFSGIHVVLHAEGRERGLVEAGQDQLLLARIGVDVADREDARHAGLELLGVDRERLLLEREAPVRDRAELRMQAEAGDHLLAAHVGRRLVARRHDAPAMRPSSIVSDWIVPSR